MFQGLKLPVFIFEHPRGVLNEMENSENSEN